MGLYVPTPKFFYDLWGPRVSDSSDSKNEETFTNGVVDRPWVVGREFESHVHHENAF